MNSPLISVIVPIYNAENCLERSIESLTNQTYGNIEIILVNDGSKDNSLKLCNELANKDKRINIIDKPNGGVSSARNYGHRSQHDVLYCFTVEAARSDCPVQCLTVTAVQRERDSQFFSVITAELEPVRAPSLIAFFHGHFASMCPFRWRYSGFSLKQQRILSHDPVNTFGIDRRHTIKFGLKAPVICVGGLMLFLISMGCS